MPRPKKFGFHQLEGDDFLAYHCGPTAIRTATGRDDLSVLDCAIPVMRPGLSDLQSNFVTTMGSVPGGFPQRALKTVIQDKLGFEAINDLEGQKVAKVISELEKRGYTHGTIGIDGHIVGFRDGVFYDVQDPRASPSFLVETAHTVLAAKQAPGAERQAWLDAEIAEVRASGEAREFCLLALARAENQLAWLMQIDNAVEDTPNRVRESVDAVARWRHYCATGDIAPDRVICEQELGAINRNIDYLQEKRPKRLTLSEKKNLASLQSVKTVWEQRCADAAMETADLCQHREAITKANLALTEREIVKARKRNYQIPTEGPFRNLHSLAETRDQALKLLVNYRDQLDVELNNWEWLCATDLSKPYKPPKKTYFDPAPAPRAKRVAAKPKAAAPVKLKDKATAAQKAADAPARRRKPRKEPVVAGALPTVSIAR